MKFESSGIAPGGMIPAKYATLKVENGLNVSPPLAWALVPHGTRSFALSVVDHHPMAANWVHWLVVDLRAGVTTLAEGASGRAMPSGARELFNSFGTLGYGGPQPPKGSGRHPYVFRIFALGREHVSLPEDAGLGSFESALAPHILDRAEFTGYFEL